MKRATIEWVAIYNAERDEVYINEAIVPHQVHDNNIQGAAK